MPMRLLSFALLLLVCGGRSGVFAQLPDARTALREDAEFVRPGDIVRLTVWREPELSGDFLVDHNGFVVIPKVGPHEAVTETPESLRAWVISTLSPYLRNPVIEVLVLRRVKVLGSVERPGMFNVDPTMTMGDALALAGGVRATGRRDRIQLVREGQVIQANLTEDMRVGDTPIRSGDEIYVPEKSWLTRNAGTVLSAGTALVGVLVALLVR